MGQFDVEAALRRHLAIRELVSRNLSRFQAEGVIKLEGKTVIVPNMAGLETEVESGQ